MKKTTTKTVKETVSTQLEKATEKAVKKSRTPNKDTVTAHYNPKEIKIDIKGELRDKVSAYYATRMHLVELCHIYQGNVKVYENAIARIIEKDVLSEDDKKAIEENQRELLRQQACYKYFKAKTNKEMKEIFADIPEKVYNAYALKLSDKDGYKNALKEWLATYDITLSDSFFDFVYGAIGMKSCGQNKRMENVHIDVMGKNAFTTLLMDILLQLSLDKQVLSKKVIEKTLSETVVDIDEFKDITVITRPSYKATIKDYKKIFDEIGVSYAKNIKKEECIKEYKKALKSGLFAEM